MHSLSNISIVIVLSALGLTGASASAVMDFDLPGAVADYDDELCVTAQRLIAASDGTDFEIVVKRAAAGSGFGTLQMDIDAATGIVVVAMLMEQVEIDAQIVDVSAWCKMVNQARINDVLNRQLTATPRSCRDVNEYTYRHALASLSVAERIAYQAGGMRLRFDEDYNAGAGAAWIPSVVNDFIKPIASTGDGPGYLGVRAPSVQVAWDPLSRDWYKGTHHCKLITLAAMKRWMTEGALRGDTQLFRRSTPVCTEPARMTSVAGSCVQYFGPADAMFCTDFSGAGWTVDSARAECAERHTTEADWLATERSYVGAGGVFS